MAAMTTALTDLETKARAGEPFSRADAERVWASPDLAAIGALGESLRKAWRGDRVTFGRVCEAAGDLPEGVGDAGELRLTGVPGSVEEARARVRRAATRAKGVPLTGFSLADLLELAGGDHLILAEIAAALLADGLEAVADVPVDRLGDADSAAEALRAISHAGLGAWRATVDSATPGQRLDLIERAADIQQATAAFRAFAPLPRVDSSDAPSTGYDDVRTIAAARMVCQAIPSIQVDWPLYGPKLAQVAIAYGADDLDGVSATDALQLGHRRSPREDIERQIRAAFGQPAERNGRYELLP